MKYNIEDGSKQPESNEVDRNAMGGTELMKNALYERIPSEVLDNFQIIPSRVRELDDDKMKILWLHDLPNDPESEHLKDGGWKKFDKLVFVSYWQQQQYANYLGVPYEAGVVLKNAIEPFKPEEIAKTNPEEDGLRLIYHTTPHRGLELLVPIFDQLQKKYENIHLDVFSSFNAYGWPERDEPFEELFKKIEDHDHMTYHGFQPNEVVREALAKAHIFAYPSVWPETSCIAMMEAMSAGCLCVHSSLAALPETTANWTYMYSYQETPQRHANAFGASLDQAIELMFQEPHRVNIGNRLAMQKNYADAFYSWDIRKQEWSGLLQGMLNNKAQEKGESPIEIVKG